MGLFHCPLGAVGFGDEGCIRCGLCSAATAERKKAAAEILRAWIREHGSSRKDIKIQKNKIIDLKRTRLVKSSRQLMPATFL